MTIYGDISSILLIDNDITLIQCGIIVTDDKRRLLYVTYAHMRQRVSSDTSVTYSQSWT
jgi:hypothetical protein